MGQHQPTRRLKKTKKKNAEKNTFAIVSLNERSPVIGQELFV